MPEVGQVWQAVERLPGGEARFVRVDELLVKPEIQTILGLQRWVKVRHARVSTRPESSPTWRRSNRTIRLDRFGRFYRLTKGHS